MIGSEGGEEVGGDIGVGGRVEGRGFFLPASD